jgi:hypothetical protein
MASCSNPSSSPQYIAITRVGQVVMARIILVDFATLDKKNVTLAADEMKD